MPVNVDPAQITPYTSTVPLVQVPPDAVEGQTRPAQPLQGQFGGGKGQGKLAIGDSLLKGFMLGHQQKEQRKTAQAQATINAADAASEAAYSEYQTALTSAGGKQDDPKAQAAYQAYLTAFQAGKQAKAQFVIPEKTQKGKKADTATGPDGKKKPPSAGFNNIKDFFEANPHIVPQIALLTMQPKPAGLSPEGQQSVQNLESQRQANQKNQVQQQNEQTYQNGFSTYAHLGPDEIAALPPETKKGYETWQNARAAITPLKYTGTSQLYRLPGGKPIRLFPEEQQQFYPDATPIVPGEAKPGQTGFALQKYAEKLGKKVEDLTWDEIEASKAEDRAGTTPQTTTTSGTVIDPQGDRTTTTTRKAAPGGITKPPTAQAAPTGQRTQGITAPPQGAKTAKQGGITPPPGGKQTALKAQVTRQANTAKETSYATAQINKDKLIQAANRQYQADLLKYGADAAEQLRQGAISAANDEYKVSTGKADKIFDAAVKSIGGTPRGSSSQNKYNVGDTVMVNGQKVKITSIDPKTGKATGEPVGD